MPDYSGHMTHEEYFAGSRQRLLQTARDVLNGRLSLVQGATFLWQLLCELGLNNDDAFIVIKVADSDADRFAFGETRKLWSRELLAKRDAELHEYEQLSRSRIEDACRKIINRYEPTQGQPGDSEC